MVRARVRRKSVDQSGPLKVFSVYNTSHKKLLVLAKDREAAGQIARDSGHTYAMFQRQDRFYPNVAESTVPLGDDEARHWDAIQFAAQQGFEGTLHLDDGGLYLGHEVVK